MSSELEGTPSARGCTQVVKQKFPCDSRVPRCYSGGVRLRRSAPIMKNQLRSPAVPIFITSRACVIFNNVIEES